MEDFHAQAQWAEGRSEEGYDFGTGQGIPRQRDLQNESAKGENIGYVTAHILKRFSNRV